MNQKLSKQIEELIFRCRKEHDDTLEINEQLVGWLYPSINHSHAAKIRDAMQHLGTAQQILVEIGR